MAEYKGKLLKGLFTNAKNVILSNGKTAESLILKSAPFSGNTTSLGQLQLFSDGSNKALVGVVYTTYASDFKYGVYAQNGANGEYGVVTAFNTSNAAYAGKTIGGIYYYYEI